MCEVKCIPKLFILWLWMVSSFETMKTKGLTYNNKYFLVNMLIHFLIEVFRITIRISVKLSKKNYTIKYMLTWDILTKWLLWFGFSVGLTRITMNWGCSEFDFNSMMTVLLWKKNYSIFVIIMKLAQIKMLAISFQLLTYDSVNNRV